LLAKKGSNSGSIKETVPYHIVCVAQKQAIRNTEEAQDKRRVDQEYCGKNPVDQR
jgi:hypothetical protein